MKKCYQAMVIECDGKIKSIAYKCNKKDKCCNSEMCGKECQYTLNKECAIDIASEEDNQVIETYFYSNGELVKKIVEYKR